MKYNLTIQQEDYGFVTEAIKLRTSAILESFDMQKAAQDGAALQSIRHPEHPLAAAEVKKEGGPIKSPAKDPEAWGLPKKKPHWTQTAKGRKIMAARKRKGTK